MKKILLLIVSISTLFSCSKDDDKLKIRLSNVSQFEFKNIVVDTNTGNTNFENISSKQMTSYKTFESAYRYAYVELEIDGETYVIQPIDYVGETQLEDGNYTYQIDANDSQDLYGKLTLRLIVE